MPDLASAAVIIRFAYDFVPKVWRRFRPPKPPEWKASDFVL